MLKELMDGVEKQGTHFRRSLINRSKVFPSSMSWMISSSEFTSAMAQGNGRVVSKTVKLPTGGSDSKILVADVSGVFVPSDVSEER
jgi:hypothetical protein